MIGDPEDTVVDATERAIAAARHLTDMDAGALAALRALARKIDTEDVVREVLTDLQKTLEVIHKVPQLDNVSIPTYLKFCESLGLTPTGRLRVAEVKEPQSGKLAQLRAVNDPAAPKRRPRRTAAG